MIDMFKESQKLPIGVRIWMGIMMLTFIAHIPFYYSFLHILSLGGFYITAFVLAPMTFMATKNIQSLAVCHFILWPVVITYGVITLVDSGLTTLSDIELAVLIMGYVVFVISLLLDYRILISELGKRHVQNLRITHEPN